MPKKNKERKDNLRDLAKTLSNICDGAFLRKKLEVNIFTEKLHDTSLKVS